jgi:hypothetical protein
MDAIPTPARGTTHAGGTGAVARLSALSVLNVLSAMLALASLVLPTTTQGQTDYYNLDRGRPLRVEDALVIERHAIEWQLAPLRVSGSTGAGSRVALEPEVAWGVWARTQLEVGVPLVRVRESARTSFGGAGIDVSILHALNAETVTIPGLALGAHLLVPAGPFGPSRVVPTLSALATRTLSGGRVHVNASVTPGTYAASDGGDDASRWSAGVAVDHAFVFQSMLAGADLVARRPLVGSGDVEWSAATGVRYQVGPRAGVDVGIGRTLGGRDEWFVTAGSALSLSLLHRFGGVR